MSDRWTINLICCTDVILQDIDCKQATRKAVGLTYAMAIKSEAEGADRPDWAKINHAIKDRWGVRGLAAVKNRAWKLIEGRATP